MSGMTELDPAGVRGSAGDGDSAAADEAAPLWDRATQSFERWRAGDARAMDELVRIMTPVLWHVVRAYGLERALAEDVVQSTWLTLVRGHASIADPHAVAGWLTTTARREAWRVGRAHAHTVTVDTDDLAPRLPPADSAEEAAQAGDSDHRLWAAVRRLDARCQRLLRVVAFEERPDYARIARDLGMPVGSIGPTRQRCLGKLRTLLSADGWEEDRHVR
jgi:RNA polymerase sigma factor (sigma-70 family)